MKYYFGAVAIALLLNSDSVQAHKLNKHHHHHHGSSWEKDFVQIGLRANNDMLAEVEDKMKKVTNLIEVKKLEEACDADCQAKCDKDADEMIRR